MQFAKPLPTYLVQRFQGWNARNYAENSAWFERLAADGQRPRAMVVSCCDSRVNITSIFAAEEGEIFVNRNIANVVPPKDISGPHGTAASLEYAVTVLKVSHIVVVGHSHCGGAQACIDVCDGLAPQLEDESSFVGRWIEALRPAYEKVKHMERGAAQSREMEKQGVLMSLRNLMEYPFVKEAVESGYLSLHGVWHDIGGGGLEYYDTKSDKFRPV